MKTIKEGFKYLCKGFVEGIKLWRTMFNMPIWLCWVCGILTMPINILIMITLIAVKGSNGFSEYMRETVEYIKNQEEGA